MLSDEQAEEVPKLIAKSEEASAREQPEPDLIPVTIAEKASVPVIESSIPEISLDFR
jgi:hypothetical protein